MEFENVKWKLGGCSGRMILTNEYKGYVVDGEIVDKPYEWLVDEYIKSKQLIKQVLD